MTLKYSLAILLPEQDDIVVFRQQHNQVYTPPHVTLVYPTVVYAKEHIRRVLSSVGPFTLTLTQTAVSKRGCYLYLLVQEADFLTQLHNQLHSGPLRDERNPDMPTYVPHLTLGVFDTEEELNAAKQSFTQTARISAISFLTHDSSGAVIKQEDIDLTRVG